MLSCVLWIWNNQLKYYGHRDPNKICTLNRQATFFISSSADGAVGSFYYMALMNEWCFCSHSWSFYLIATLFVLRNVSRGRISGSYVFLCSMCSELSVFLSCRSPQVYGDYIHSTSEMVPVQSMRLGVLISLNWHRRVGKTLESHCSSVHAVFL